MKRKRLISIIGLILCAVSSLCLFSACNDDTHTHNYTTEVIAPTCAEQGYTIYTCDCGNSYNADYTSALGHNFINYISNNDATFESDGTKTAVCERDGCNVTDTKIDVGSILTHSHNYTTEVIAPTCTEQGYTIYTCDCGNSYNADYVDALGHSFVNYISNNDATYEADGTKTATCEREECVETNTITDIGSILTHTHNYDTEVILPTCTKQGYTVYACDCGNSYNADYTSALGHSFVNYVSNNDATYDADGTKTATCERTGCNQTNTITDIGSMLVHSHDYDTEVIAPTCTEQGYTVYTCDCGNSYNADYISALGHNFVNYVSNNDATYEADGTKTATCERTGCNQTNTIADVGSMLVKNGIVFKTLTLNSADNTAHGKVANGTQVFSFLNEIQVLGNSSYTVSTDITGINIIPTKTVPLMVGDNVFYVLADNQNNDFVLYTVTIRVRPLYTVTFNTQSENNIESQSIEEDSFATMPSDSLEKTGYTFIGWDFDFSTPISENITVTANWKANEYTVSFDGNGVDNPESITLTYDDAYKNLPIIERNGYTFNGWFTEKDGGTQIASTDKVQITADQTLYAHWTINTYSLSIVQNISNAGTIETNIANGTYEYSTEITFEILTTNLGYDYLGLYDGETLITANDTYSFALPATDVNYTVKWQVKEEMSDFYFTSTTTTCVVNGLKNKNATKIIIPDYVSSIKSYAFNDESCLISVQIGNSVTNIEDYTFESCCNLTSITLGPDVTSIGYKAFSGCCSLTSITIPNKVSSIEEYAFSGCCALAEINFNATAMEDLPKNNYVFGGVGSNCATTIVNIAANVNKIPAYLFNSMPSTTTVSVKFSTGSICSSIGACAFYGCIGLVDIDMPNNITNIGNHAFYNCSNLLSITIPDKVSSIGQYAFYGCTGLTDIAIPDSVTSMGYNTFWGCTSLAICCETSSKPSGWSSVWADDACAVIWNCAGTTMTQNGVKYALTNDNTMVVYGCDDTVKEIEIEDSVQGYSVTTINEKAFYENKNLTSLIIGDNVTNIEQWAFYKCSNLTNITIGNGVASIESSAFSGCSGLQNIIIPNSVTSIGSSAFYGCSGLTSITIPFVGANKAGTTNTYFAYIFGGNTSIPTSLKSVTITNANSIGDNAFYGCTGLTSITILNSVNSVGASAFYLCTNLTSVTLPNSVISIGEYAFYECAKLKSVALPCSITSVANGTFYGCTSLTSMEIPDKVTSIGSSAFYNCTSLQAVTFNENSELTSIGSSAFSSCTSLTSMEIPDKVTSIASSAFYNCTSLQAVTFDENSELTSIGSSAFSSCTSLTSMEIPVSVTSIEEKAFYGCTSLISIEIPENVISIGSKAFYACRNISNIVVKESNTAYKSIDGNLYTADGTVLIQYAVGKTETSFVIPDSIITIDSGAFVYCENLTSITIPNSVTTIGGSAFAYCENLASITIPNSVTVIGGSAFIYCSSLTSITIPSNVSSIGSYAFYGCSSLERAIFDNTTGWRAGDEDLTIYNYYDNARMLTDTYSTAIWKRS